MSNHIQLEFGDKNWIVLQHKRLKNWVLEFKDQEKYEVSWEPGDGRVEKNSDYTRELEKTCPRLNFQVKQCVSAPAPLDCTHFHWKSSPCLWCHSISDRCHLSHTQTVDTFHWFLCLWPCILCNAPMYLSLKPGSHPCLNPLYVSHWHFSTMGLTDPWRLILRCFEKFTIYVNFRIYL